MSRSFLMVLPKEMRSGVARRPRAPSRSRGPRRCRSTSRARPAATAPPAPGSPSRRRTRACRAASSRRSGSCRARRRGRRRGTGPRPAGVAAVAQEVADALGHGALLTKANGPCMRAQVEVQGARARPASAGEVGALAVRWRHGRARRALHPRCCLGLERETRSARPARWTSLFGVDLWRADETKEARSVVALSRVPR